MALKNPLFPIATALKETIRGYSSVTFRHDAIAGLVVSLVALPLAMALAIAVNLPPQHGIYTAIVAGIAAALFGGSATQVSGPTAAFVVIVAPIISQHGLRGIIWCQIMAGIMLILGVAKLGKYIRYMPYPVVTGFTAGIAMVIATLALNDFLGLGIKQLHGDYLEKIFTLIAHLAAVNPFEVCVGMLSLLTILFCGKLTKALPSPIIGIAIGTFVAFIFSQYGIDIATIGSRFTYTTVQGIQHGIPPYPPTFHLPNFISGSLFYFPSYAEFKTLLFPAVVIAILAALESLLSATIADNMTGSRHNPNAELNAVGISNILSGLACGLPATGAIARTATNIQSGAKTPIAAIIHAFLIMLYVLLLSPFINYIPMAALAALLLSTAYHMSHIKQFIRIIKIAPSSDTFVLLTCFSLTAFIDMVVGVTAGILLALLLYLRQNTLIKLSKRPSENNYRTQSLLPESVLLHRMNGPLFFGTSESTYNRQQFNQDHVSTVIIDMENVSLIDMSGLVAMKAMLAAAAKNGRNIILCGRKDITERILHKISDHPIRQYVKSAATVKDAIARDLIGI